MSTDVQAALWGAAVGGALTIVATVIQHFLSLREDSVKRQRDEVYDKAASLRRRLLAGSSEAAERGTYE